MYARPGSWGRDPIFASLDAAVLQEVDAVLASLLWLLAVAAGSPLLGLGVQQAEWQAPRLSTSEPEGWRAKGMCE